MTALARGNGYLYIGADNGLVRMAEKELAGNERRTEPRIRKGVGAFACPLILTATLLTRLAWGDAGVLLPGDKKEPDPAWLSLEEMTIDIHIDNGHARVSTKPDFREPPAHHAGGQLISSPCLAAPLSPISPCGTTSRAFPA